MADSWVLNSKKASKPESGSSTPLKCFITSPISATPGASPSTPPPPRTHNSRRRSNCRPASPRATFGSRSASSISKTLSPISIRRSRRLRGDICRGAGGRSLQLRVECIGGYALQPMVNARAEETLDPHDWNEMFALSHRIVDDAVEFLRHVRDRPVWRDMPADVRSFFTAALPRVPEPLADVYRDVSANLMPYPMGNIHPPFWSCYMGSSNYTGAIGDFLAAIQGSNLGGGNHAAALMDQQVIGWCKEMVGFPASASGTLVSGGSMANIIGLTVARNVKADVDVRERGVRAIEKPLRFYGSDQIHSCHRKAIETLGLGNQALRRIPCDSGFRIDLSALRAAIAEDRAEGSQPACVIGTAGTVNTGAIDDLRGLARLAREE